MNAERSAYGPKRHARVHTNTPQSDRTQGGTQTGEGPLERRPHALCVATSLHLRHNANRWRPLQGWSDRSLYREPMFWGLSDVH